MKIEILAEGRGPLRTYNHEGESFVEAPQEGAYDIRLTNDSGFRRLAILSVDGLNVVDGTTAGYDGPGYVLRPWETLTIKGWRRSDQTVAKFTFKAQEASYAAQTGHGTKNTGVIGAAIFDEKAAPPRYAALGCTTRTSYSTFDTTGPIGSVVNDIFTCSVPSGAGPSASASSSTVRRTKSSGRGDSVLRSRRLMDHDSDDAVDLGTGYGKEVAMFTETTTFERASETPVQVKVLRYAVRERLIEWGVPVVEFAHPQAFPASVTPSVPAPPGWRG